MLAVVVLSVGEISAAALRLVTRHRRGYSLADSTSSTVSRYFEVRKINVSVCQLLPCLGDRDAARECKSCRTWVVSRPATPHDGRRVSLNAEELLRP